MHSHPSAKRACLFVLLALAIGVFSIRGIKRAVTRSSDFEMVYAGSLAWRVGGDVYTPESLLHRFRAHGGDPDLQRRTESFEALYPPSTYALLSPITFFEWPAAKWVWIVLNIALTAILIWLALVLVDWHGPDRIAWMIVIVLLFAPLQGGISLGQLSLLCTCLMLGGILSLRSGRDVLAGVLLGLAATVKPQLGAVLVLLLPMVGAWRGFITACVIGLALLGLGAMRLYVTGIPWFEPMLQAIHRCSPNGNFGGGRYNGTWYNVISLETLISRFVGNAALVTGLSLLLGVLVLGIIWFAHPKRKFTLTASALLTLTLLLTYHRFYDCVVLLLPAAIVASNIRRLRELRGAFVLIGIGLLVFYLPNSAAISNRLGDLFGQSVKSSPVFQATVMTHQIWAIIAILLGLLLWLWRERVDAVDLSSLENS